MNSKGDTAPRSPSSALLPTFLGEGSPKIDYRKKLIPTYSNLSTGGTRHISSCEPLRNLQKLPADDFSTENGVPLA